MTKTRFVHTVTTIMTSETGFNSRRMLLPRSRVLVCDVLRLFQAVPTTAQSRIFKLHRVEETRQQVPQRMSWPAIFLKSYSAVCARNARLCQSWVNWPFPHVVQHTEPVATVAVQRKHAADDWLLWGKIRAPHQVPLRDVQLALDRFTQEPVEDVFRQQLQLSALPSFLRRFIWWWNLNVSGAKRSKRLGTFLLTTVAGRGAEIEHPPGFLTTSLTYGPLNARNECRVTLAYDHRLMDGAFVAERLAELEEQILSLTLSELEELCRHPNLSAEAA